MSKRELMISAARYALTKSGFDLQGIAFGTGIDKDDGSKGIFAVAFFKDKSDTRLGDCNAIARAMELCQKQCGINLLVI